MGFSGSERAPANTPEDEKRGLEEQVKELAAENKDLFLEQGLDKWHIEYLEQQHGVDYLTGIKSREVFERELERSLQLIRGEVAEQRANGDALKEISLISIDLDHFKNINDTFGHPAGDEVLRRVSALLRSSVRDTDIVARVGGEELMVLMRGADVNVAAHHAEELRAKIAQLAFADYPELKVTASFGVVSSSTSTDATVLKENVDKALYAAKHGGRNRVEISD